MLGTDNIYKFEFVNGQEAFWRGINRDPMFFANLMPMRDAYVLWNVVKRYRPTILTALPHKNADHVDDQKRRWVAHYLGPDVPVITCLTKDKPNFCSPGSVLVDDRAINQEKWCRAGGDFIVHQNAYDTLDQLSRMGMV